MLLKTVFWIDLSVFKHIIITSQQINMYIKHISNDLFSIKISDQIIVHNFTDRFLGSFICQNLEFRCKVLLIYGWRKLIYIMQCPSKTNPSRV